MYVVDHHKRFREVRVQDAASQKLQYFVHPETLSPQVVGANHRSLLYSTATVRFVAVYSTRLISVAQSSANLYYALCPIFCLSLPVAKEDQRELEEESLDRQRELQRPARGEYVGLRRLCPVRQ